MLHFRKHWGEPKWPSFIGTQTLETPNRVFTWSCVYIFRSFLWCPVVRVGILWYDMLFKGMPLATYNVLLCNHYDYLSLHIWVTRFLNFCEQKNTTNEDFVFSFFFLHLSHLKTQKPKYEKYCRRYPAL